MSVEEKIEKELKGRKKGTKKVAASELPSPGELAGTPSPLEPASLAQQELFHLQRRSDMWTLWTVGIVAIITMLAFLGLWPKGSESWLARIVWKLVLVCAVGALALLASRTMDRIQRRTESLMEIVNDAVSRLGERYRLLKLDSEYVDSDIAVKSLFIKAAAVVAAVSILFII